MSGLVWSHVWCWAIVAALFWLVAGLAPATGGVNVVVYGLALLWCYRGAVARACSGRGGDRSAPTFREARSRMTPVGRVRS